MSMIPYCTVPSKQNHMIKIYYIICQFLLLLYGTGTVPVVELKYLYSTVQFETYMVKKLPDDTVPELIDTIQVVKK